MQRLAWATFVVVSVLSISAVQQRSLDQSARNQAAADAALTRQLAHNSEALKSDQIDTLNSLSRAIRR